MAASRPTPAAPAGRASRCRSQRLGTGRGFAGTIRTVVSSSETRAPGAGGGSAGPTRGRCAASTTGSRGRPLAPLAWPIGWPRTRAGDRERSRFRNARAVDDQLPMSDATSRLIRECRLQGVRSATMTLLSNADEGFGGLSGAFAPGPQSGGPRSKGPHPAQILTSPAPGRLQVVIRLARHSTNSEAARHRRRSPGGLDGRPAAFGASPRPGTRWPPRSANRGQPHRMPAGVKTAGTHRTCAHWKAGRWPRAARSRYPGCP